MAVPKESLKNDAYYEYVHSKLKGIIYRGNYILTHNNDEAKFYGNLGVCKTDNIKVVGLQRLDRLHKLMQGNQVLNNGPEGVLFSFFYCYGLPLPKNWQGIDQRYEDFGWNMLFDNVHLGFIGMAIENPSLRFVIKLQWMEFWYNEINNLAISGYKKSIQEIPNLKVTSDADVYDLIFNARCIVAFNSTVVIEALAAKRKIVIPDFDECMKKEYRPFVIFPGKSDAYYSPGSTEEYIQIIRKLAKSKNEAFTEGSYKRARKEILGKYAYKFDGRCSKRTIECLDSIVSQGKNGY